MHNTHTSNTTTDRNRHRVWSKVLKRYLQSSYLSSDGTELAFFRAQSLPDVVSVYEDNFVIEKCSGLCDLHNYPVFENDIVLMRWEEQGLETTQTHKITYKNATFCTEEKPLCYYLELPKFSMRRVDTIHTDNL